MFFSNAKEMSQAATWFLLLMFVALCAIVVTVVRRRDGGYPKHGFDTEYFGEGAAEYEGGDTRAPPPELEGQIEDPDSDALAPGEAPGMPPTAPGAPGMGGSDGDHAEDVEDGDMMASDPANGIEPFSGEEFEAF